MKSRRVLLTLLSMLIAFGLASHAANAQPAPSCSVAVMAGGDGIELPQLHATLTALGVSWVDVTSLAEAQTANASVIIDRYDADNLPSGDIDTWLNSGRGFIQLGDWPNLFANDYTFITNGAPITVTVADPASPLAAGLAASWTGRGFWAYDVTSEDYIGWATDTALPDVAHAQFGSTTHTRVVSSELVGSGRAVYIGINVYGSAAGPNETRLLSNAISWAGNCAIGPVEAIPALGGIGLALFIAVLALVGVALITRLR